MKYNGYELDPDSIPSNRFTNARNPEERVELVTIGTDVDVLNAILRGEATSEMLEGTCWSERDGEPVLHVSKAVGDALRRLLTSE